MGRSRRNLAGNQYGRIVAIDLDHENGDLDAPVMWRCRCLCGGMKYVTSRALNVQETRSCGCLFRRDSLSYEQVKRAIAMIRRELNVSRTFAMRRIPQPRIDPNGGGTLMWMAKHTFDE